MIAALPTQARGLRPCVRLALLLLLTGCGMPPEIDTPQLNANAEAKLQAYASSGKCTPGTYQGNVTDNDKQFTRECIVQGDVYVDGDPTQLKRLRHIKQVLGAIHFRGPTDLAEALPDLERSSWIRASGYTGKHLHAPPKLVECAGLTVENNPTIQTISGFDSVKTMQWLRITGNTALVSISGFGQITTLAGVDIEANPKLASFTALPKLGQTGELVFKGCPALTELPAMPLLTKVGIVLTLVGLPAAKVLGFPALQSVPTLKIETAANATQLAFPVLGNVDVIWLHELPALTTLAGLAKINVVKQVSICVEAVPCAELEAFAVQHTPGLAQASWTKCGAWVACKK